MTFTTTEKLQVEQIEANIVQLELTIKDLETASNNYATKKELKNLLALLNQQVQALKNELVTNSLLSTHLTHENAHTNLATYYRKIDHISFSTGIADSNKPLVTNNSGVLDLSLFNSAGLIAEVESNITHGNLIDLNNDDHLQYLTVERHSGIIGNPHSLTLNDIGATAEVDFMSHVNNSSIHHTEASLVHSGLSGLSSDDHSQYALLAGRSGGQTLNGDTIASGNLTLSSTANATKGSIVFGTSSYDEVNNRLFVKTGSSVVTGSAAEFGDTIYVNAAIWAASASSIGWISRSRLYSPGNGYLRLSNATATAGAGLDFISADVLKVRNHLFTADGRLTAGEYFGSSTLTNSGLVSIAAPTKTVSSSNDYALSITDTLNAATGTGTYTGIKYNLTKTQAAGWTTRNLIDLQHSGVSMFKVSDTGGVTATNLTSTTNLICTTGLFMHGQIYLNGGAVAGNDSLLFYTSTTPPSTRLTIPYGSANSFSNVMTITTDASRSDTYPHAAQVSPTIFLHSATSGTTATDEWISFSHNTIDGVIGTGKGGLLVSGVVRTTATSNDYALLINDTLNAGTGTGTYTGIKLNIAETQGAGWTTKNLIDLQHSGISIFKVRDDGLLTLGGVSSIATTGGITTGTVNATTVGATSQFNYSTKTIAKPSTIEGQIILRRYSTATGAVIDVSVADNFGIQNFLGTAPATFWAGAATFSGVITTTGGVIASDANHIGWANRTRLTTPANGKLVIGSAASTFGVHLDTTPGDSLSIKNFAGSAPGALWAGAATFSGLVGIQTASPVFPLTVNAVTGNTAAQFGSGLPIYLIANAPCVGFNIYYNSGWKFGTSSVNRYGSVIWGDFLTGNLDFYSSDSGNAGATATITKRMTIAQNGNIGIGTGAPVYKLDVFGDANMGNATHSGIVTATTGFITNGSSVFGGTTFSGVVSIADSLNNATTFTSLANGGLQISTTSAAGSISILPNNILNLGTSNSDGINLGRSDAQVLNVAGLKLLGGITLTSASNNDYLFSGQQTLNAGTGTGTYHGMLFNLTQTNAAGWTTKNLINLQVDGVTQFSVNSVGAVGTASIVATSTISAAQYRTSGFYRMMPVSINRMKLTNDAGTTPSVILDWNTIDNLSVINAAGTSPGAFWAGNATFSGIVDINPPTLTTPTSNDYAVRIQQTINAPSGSGVYAALRIDQTRTDGTGYPSNNLIAGYRDGALQFYINYAGSLSLNGSMSVNGGTTSVAGGFTAAAASIHNWTGRSRISSPADGTVLIQNNAATTDATLRIGSLFTSSNSVFSGTITTDAIISSTANPAAAGSIRLANTTDTINFRNATNTADLSLYGDASNRVHSTGTFYADSALMTAGSIWAGATYSYVWANRSQIFSPAVAKITFSDQATNTIGVRFNFTNPDNLGIQNLAGTSPGTLWAGAATFSGLVTGTASINITGLTTSSLGYSANGTAALTFAATLRYGTNGVGVARISNSSATSGISIDVNTNGTALFRDNTNAADAIVRTGALFTSTDATFSGIVNISNSTTTLSKDISNNLTFTDTIAGVKTLKQLSTGSGGRQIKRVNNIIGGQVTYNAIAGDIVLGYVASGDILAILPSATTNSGEIIMAKKICNCGYGIILSGTQNIDGSDKYIVDTYLSAMTVASDGIEWWII